MSADDNAPEQAREVEVVARVLRDWVLPGVPPAVMADLVLASLAPMREAERQEVEDLRRWKTEGLEVMRGLQEVGRALGVGLGQRITARATVDRALDLCNERDAAVAEAERLRESIAAERQEAARAAAERAWIEGVQACDCDHMAYHAHKVGEYGYATHSNPYRADGPTGRSGT